MSNTVLNLSKVCLFETHNSRKSMEMNGVYYVTYCQSVVPKYWIIWKAKKNILFGLLRGNGEFQFQLRSVGRINGEII